MCCREWTGIFPEKCIGEKVKTPVSDIARFLIIFMRQLCVACLSNPLTAVRNFYYNNTDKLDNYQTFQVPVKGE